MSIRYLRALRPSTSTITSCVYLALMIVVTAMLLKIVDTVLYKQCHDALRSYETLSRFDETSNKKRDITTKVLAVERKLSNDPSYRSTRTISSLWNGRFVRRGEDKSTRERAWLSIVERAFLDTGRSDRDVVATTIKDNNVSKVFNQRRRIRDSTRLATKDVALTERLTDLKIGLFDR